MKIVLFGSPRSPFVKKVQGALHLKKADYEIVEPRSPGDFKKWSPQTRKMPVMQLDEERIYDSTFVCQRLDEVLPEPPLLSSDPARRAAQRLIEDWSDESLYWHLMALRWADRNEAATLDQIAGTLPAFVRPFVRPLLRRQVDLAKYHGRVLQATGQSP